MDYSTLVIVGVLGIWLGWWLGQKKGKIEVSAGDKNSRAMKAVGEEWPPLILKSPKNPNGKKILLVDDDKFLLEMYSSKFVECGFQVIVAMDGQEALDKLKTNLKPDILVTDILMPKLDGFKLIEELKREKLNKKFPIIILSNLGQKEDIDKGMALGIQGYIIKAEWTPIEVVDRMVKIYEQWKKDQQVSI